MRANMLISHKRALQRLCSNKLAMTGTALTNLKHTISFSCPIEHFSQGTKGDISVLIKDRDEMKKKMGKKIEWAVKIFRDYFKMQASQRQRM